MTAKLSMDNEAAAGESDKHDDEAVADYLLKNPDFLVSHPEVLAALDIGRREAGVVSLVERQLAVLRKQNSDVEKNRVGLIETARANQRLSICLHRVALELLRGAATDHVPVSRVDKACRVSRSCCTVLLQGITGVHVVLHWFRGFLSDEIPSGTLVVTDESDQSIAGFVHSLFAIREPSCGPFSASEKLILLDRLAPSAQSAAVAALVEPDTGARMGMLVLAGDDPTRFASGKGTMFLVQLVQLIEHAFTPTQR